MGFWSKVSGTLVDWFGFGGSETIAVGKDGSGNLRLKDEVAGEHTLSDLLDDDQVKVKVDSGDTFTVKEDHQHIVHGEFTAEGEYIVEGESVILGGHAPSIFDAYDGSGGTAVTTSWTNVPLDQVDLNTGGYSHSSHEVEIPEDGVYRITARVGAGITSGSSRTSGEVQVTKNGTPIGGMRGFLYFRLLNRGEDGETLSKPLELSKGDKIVLQIKKIGSDTTVELLANGSALCIEGV